ncbi:conserved hypothetical protein [Candidatus Sulfopaludibacter sp. SbA4]|nr:conserved hypothetical protein [Candidatus Sulfopaludibacter sp. SbA4]
MFSYTLTSAHASIIVTSGWGARRQYATRHCHRDKLGSVTLSRRVFLASPALALAAPLQPRVACIMNTWFPDSHADVFVSRLLDGYRLDRAWHPPRLHVASFYVDQFPSNDMAREEAEEHGVAIYPTVAQALRLGGPKLAVDAVAIIGEHGNYPRTPRGNFMYPRWRYFSEATQVMRDDGRVIPMYQDKYLAYDWRDARSTYDRVREMHIPFQCGSTVPLAWQRPPLDIPHGTRFSELLTTSYSDLEEHAYHGIELLQSMAERRAGAETGVARVRWCGAAELGKLAGGEWSQDLLDAALARRVNRPPDASQVPPQAFFIRYRDGLKGAVLHLDPQTRDFLFAARIEGRADPVATCFYIELYLHNHWGFMVRNFEDLVLTRRNPIPIERTLVANGIMLAGLESRRLGGQWVDTPELGLRYSASH